MWRDAASRAPRPALKSSTASRTAASASDGPSVAIVPSGPMLNLRSARPGWMQEHKRPRAAVAGECGGSGPTTKITTHIFLSLGRKWDENPWNNRSDAELQLLDHSK